MKKLSLKISSIMIVILLCFTACEKDTNSRKTNEQGKSGSITRFAIVGHYLYSLSNNEIVVFDIRNNNNPVKINSVKVAYNIETIFSYIGKLYIGATDGIYIVDISNPTIPVIQAKESHQVGCDPVVVKNTIAYSTVRQGTGCSGAYIPQSLLLVINVADAYNPYTISTIQMASPQGLGYDGNNLFVCDGANGIEIFDISNPASPTPIQSIESVNAVDVITDNGLLIVSTPDSYNFYDYTNINHIIKLSQIDKN
ncbi:MAG: hypothetical protein U0U67_17690 [Chitinophagales bacterium]